MHEYLNGEVGKKRVKLSQVGLASGRQAGRRPFYDRNFRVPVLRLGQDIRQYFPPQPPLRITNPKKRINCRFRKRIIIIVLPRITGKVFSRKPVNWR